MEKGKWYYRNQRTGEITDMKDLCGWWAEGGDYVDCLYWSDVLDEWTVFMIREP